MRPSSVGEPQNNFSMSDMAATPFKKQRREVDYVQQKPSAVVDVSSSLDSDRLVKLVQVCLVQLEALNRNHQDERSPSASCGTTLQMRARLRLRERK